MIVGTLGSIRRAHVRGGGVVVIAAGTKDEVELSWWVGADDRWHVPACAITARQHLVRDVPIVQTSVRVPSGDAVATAFACVQSPRELMVLDIDNRSTLPFAIAFVVRGPGVRDAALDGSTLRVGGRPLLHLSARPRRMVNLPVDAAADIADVVTSGGASTVFEPVAGTSSVACIVPVSHATSVRGVLVLGASNAAALLGSPVLASLPDAHTCGDGWAAQLRRGPDVRLPDAALRARVTSHTSALLLAADPMAADESASVRSLASAAIALDRSGFAAEAGSLLADLPSRQLSKGSFEDGVPVTAAAVHALGTHASLTHDGTFAAAMVPTVAGAAELIARRAARDASLRVWLAALRSAADVFDAAGDHRAATQATRMWERHGAPWPMPALDLAPLPAVAAGGSLVPDDIERVAAGLRGAIESVVSIGADGTLDVLRGFDESWRGQGIEVANVATPGGQLSFALRWHGARAALLWELAQPVERSVRLRASSLSPSWEANTSSGEALL